MADPGTEAQISFTANIDSLQAGVDAGEALIETLSQKIEQLNSALEAVGSAGAPALLAELEQVKAELTAAQGLTAQLASQMAGIKVGAGGEETLQSFINDTHRLSDEINSASAASRAFTSTLGMQGVSATEAAIAQRELAAAQAQAASEAARTDFAVQQARGREEVNQTIASLNGEKTAVDRITASTSMLAQQWRQTQSIQQSVSAKDFWSQYNRDMGIGVQNTQRITAATSMFANTTRGAGGAMGGLSFQTAGATREVIILAHEMASGRFSRIPGSLMVLTERMGGLSFATLGWFAAIGVTVGAIGYFIVRAIELSNVVNNLGIGAAFAGNAEVTNAAIESSIKEVEKLHNVTREQAEAIVSEYARMKDMTASELSAMTVATGEFARATGQQAPAAAKQLADMLGQENLSLKKLQETFPGVSEEQLYNTQLVMESGNQNQRTAALMNLLQDSLDKTRDAQIRVNSGMMDSFKNFAMYIGGLQAGFTYQEIENDLIEKNAKAWDAAAAAQRRAAEQKARAPLSREQILTAADIAGDQENTARTQIDETTRHIRQLEGAITAIHQKGGVISAEDEARLRRYNGDLAAAEGHLAQEKNRGDKRANFGTNLAGEEEIRQVRETNATITADVSLSAEQQHAIIAGNWKRLLSEGKLTSQQRVEVEREMWAASGQAARAGSTLTVEQGRLAVDQLKADESKGSAERLSDIVAVWAKVLASDKLAFQQRLQVQEDYYKAVADLNKYQQTQAIGIAKSDADTAREISKIKIQEQRETTQEEWQLHQISADQRLATLTKLLQDEAKLDQDAIDDELKTLHEGDANYEIAANKKRVIEAQLQADIAKLRRETQQEDERDARQSVVDWRAASDEIISTEKGLVSGIIGGRETLAQIAGKLIDNLLEKEIDADLTYLTKHLLLSKAELAADRTSEEAGFLYKVLFGAKKTTTDVAMGAKEVAVTASTETAKTGAVAAGEAARLGIKETARATASASELASGSAQIMNDASKSAAGAYSAVVGIPVIGPIIAPIAAGTAFAAVAAFDTLTSLDVGAWRVPHDMPAYIHEGESVVPKNFAEGLRDSGSVAPPAHQLADRLGLVYSPTINAPQHKSLEQLLYNESSSMIKFVQSAIRDGSIRIS